MLSFLFLLAMAQSSVAVPASDFISAIEARYKAAPGIQADFTQQTHVAIMDRDETKNGTLYFTRDKFRIEYKDPTPQDYIYNGKTLWIYSPRYKEVEIYNQASARISGEALNFLSGLGELRDLFDIQKISRHKINKTNDARRIEMIPKSDASRFKKIVLIINRHNLDIIGAELTPLQGNQTKYAFRELKTDVAFPDKKFEFVTPKGVAVQRPEF